MKPYYPRIWLHGLMPQKTQNTRTKHVLVTIMIYTFLEDAQHEDQIRPCYSQYNIHTSLKTHSTKIKHDSVAIKMLPNTHEMKSFFNVACLFIDFWAI